MGGKFPTDIGADFTWYPALGYHKETPSKCVARIREHPTNLALVSQNNIRFELANILFNLAVLYCQLAVASNRGNSDGLKAACNYFCQSAGVIAHIKNDVIPDMRGTPPEDMDQMTLECLEYLLLAQAQECFWMKAVKDNLKDATIAKLAAKVSDLYLEASDYGMKSDTISSEWIHHMSAKHHHFAAAAQYRAACDCLEKRKYGEEVSRLQDSLACVTEALKESRYVSKTVATDLNTLKAKIQDDLVRAEKDNDTIYLLPVPPKSELKSLDRASMVAARTPKEISDPISMLGENGSLGRPLFTHLVPYSVHIAASIYVSRRDQAIKSMIDELEVMTMRIHEVLKSLNLPGSLQALERPLGIPSSLASHAEEIRQQNGPERLQRTMDDVLKLKTNDRQAFQEGVAFLNSEAAEDDLARKRYGTERWTRAGSQQAGQRLYAQINDLDGYLQKAEESDKTVKDKYRESQSVIRLLNGTDEDLEEYLPNSRRRTLSSNIAREVGRLREALNGLTKLENGRKRKIESLRLKGQADDVNTDLLKEAGRLERVHPMQTLEAAQFEELFDERLKRYDVDKTSSMVEQEEQDALLSRLNEHNTSFIAARRGDTSTKAREEALQKMENAYFAYKEIVQNLEVGRKFYNDLAGLVNRFRDDCRNFAFQRRNEAAQLEADITTSLPMANLNLNLGQEQRPMQTRGAPVEEQVREQVRHVSRPSTNVPPLAAPRPVKAQTGSVTAAMAGSNTSAQSSTMWTPDMGIKFAGATPPNGGQNAGNAAANAGRGRDARWEPSRGLQFS